MTGADPPKVSVCVVTYNQADYIRECLQSVVSQQTSFPFEVLVGDDCSTDGTWAIVQEFCERFPDKVFAFRTASNSGMTANYVQVHSRARGRYVAHLDGDDLALPGKLEKQAQVLDEKSRVNIVVHAAREIDADSNVLREEHSRDRPVPAMTDLDYLVQNHCYFMHSSVMFRRPKAVRTPSRLGQEILDFEYHIQHAGQGLIYYIDEELGAYRRAAGISSTPAWANLFGPLNQQALRYALKCGADRATVIKKELSLNRVIASKFLKNKSYVEALRHVISGPTVAKATWLEKATAFWRITSFVAFIVEGIFSIQRRIILGIRRRTQ